MNKKIGLIIGVLAIVAGACIAYFGNFALADIAGFAVTMFGAGVAVSSIWNKRDTSKKTWLAVLAIILVGIGAFLLGFAGVTESVMSTIISSVFGLIAIIVGIIATVVQQKVKVTSTEV